MEDPRNFVCDWSLPSLVLPEGAIVGVAHKQKRIGLYRVKAIGMDTMTLSHGGISFPVGTSLVVDDFQKLMPDASRPLSVKVVNNNRHGIQIAW
jgi:hypothetical protein